MTQTTLREYLRTTEDAIRDGRIDEAMANCQNILTHFPEALEAQRLLGEVYLAQGQMDEARQTFEWILTNDPENVIVYCDRALISERTSDIDTALDCYQQAYELSRGSADIRQQFNKLSARAGQQEFMFSRAGLARMYMRGDLLTQAIQEWDAVLAISPDRLDARLGLMETYWRENLFDKAEQVAMSLLEEVPTCLKALLLLAHIASISNIPRARDLLMRATALDPELTKAQEFFTDLAASQPNDPFLELIKKEPILLENGRLVPAQANGRPAGMPASASAEKDYDNWETLNTWDRNMLNGSSVEQSLDEMPTQQSWNGGGEDFPTYQSLQSEPAAWISQLDQRAPVSQDEPTWYPADATSSWSSEGQEEEMTSPPAWLDTLTKSEQQTLASGSLSSLDEPTPLAPTLTPAELSPASLTPASVAIPTELSPTSLTPVSVPTPAELSPASLTSAPASKEEQPAVPEDEPTPFFFPENDESDDMGWPEWLKSLGAETLEEAEQPTPSVPLPEVASPANPSATATYTSQPMLAVSPEPSASQSESSADPWAALPTLSADNDAQADARRLPDWVHQMSPRELPATQENTSDWTQQISPTDLAPAQSITPDWMQQISPVEIPSAQDETPDWIQQISSVSNAPAQQASTPDWMQEMSPVDLPSVHDTIPDWMQQMSPVKSTPTQSEAAPNWMQQISPVKSTPAQSEAAPDWMQQFSHTPPQNQNPASTPDWMQQLSNGEPPVQQNATFSAAAPTSEQEQRYLSSLEDLEKNLQSQGFVPMEPGSLASIAQAQATPPVQSQQENQPSLSSALAQLGNFGQPPVTTETSEPWWGSQSREQTVPGIPHTPNDPFAALGARTNEETTHAFSSLPATPLPSTPDPNQSLTPTYRSDALLDNDLETTMKRPAITLQPMKTGEGQNERFAPGGKGRNGERGPTGPLDEANLSHHERLLRGYQYQLSGAYEEAMQEYRLIIRNAPELLDDVISNLRALLKINPRFSLGYRVLGDAYMRKGEYLQAMESYNKALTMAKKAKN